MQGKVAAAGLASVATLLDELPAQVRKARVVPALRLLWPPHTAGLAPDLQLALAQRFGTLISGLASSLESEQDVAAFLACFRCG